MAYQPPGKNEVDFGTQSYSPPTSTATDFQFGSETADAIAGSCDAESSLSGSAETPAFNAAGSCNIESSCDATVTAERNVDGSADTESTLDGDATTGPVDVVGGLDASVDTTDSTAKAITPAALNANSTLTGVAKPGASADLDAESTLTGDSQAAYEVTGSVNATTSTGGDADAIYAPTGDLDASAALAGDVSAVHDTTGDLDASAALAGTAEPAFPGDLDATTTLGGTAEAVVPANLDASATLTAGVSAVHDTTGDLDASAALAGDVQGAVDVAGDLDASATFNGFVDSETLDSVTATRNEDDTITVSWTVGEGTRSFASYAIDERVNGHDWMEIATVSGPEARSYTTSALPDNPETFEYRVRGIAAGRVADTRAADAKFYAQESSIRGTEPTSREPTQLLQGIPSGQGGGDIAIPPTLATGWKEEQTRPSATVPTTAIAGEGTALRIIADEYTDVDEQGDPLGVGNQDWEFGVPQTFNGRFVPDTDVDWPVTIKQTFALQIDDPDYLAGIDAFATAAGECTVNTRITKVGTVGSNIIFTLKIVLDCPTESPTDIGGGFVPNPAPDAPPDAPSGPPLPGPPSSPGGDVGPGSGGGGGDYGGTPWDDPFPYTRAVSIGGACVPEGTSDRVPISITMETGAVDEYDLHISYDPSVIEVTGASPERMTPTIVTNDTETGYLHITSDAGSDISFDPYNEDTTSVASYIEYDVLAEDGAETDMVLLPRSKALDDGSEVPYTSYGAGNVTVGGGYELPSRSVGFGQTIDYTVSTDTGVPVSGGTVRLTFPAGPVTVDAVKSTADMNVESYSFPDAGILEVDFSTPSPGRSPDLFTIEFDAYQPETPGDIRRVEDTEVNIDGALSTLRDSFGQVIQTPCTYDGAVSVIGNLDGPPDRPGDGGIGIPEAGVIYWPIYLPLTLRAAGINTKKVTEEMVQVSFQSDTNPDIDYEVYNIEVGPERAPNTIIVDTGVFIMKADPQQYPVDLAGKIWFALSDAQLGGGGIIVGAPAFIGGEVNGLTATMHFQQLGLGSGSKGLDI